MKTTTSRPPSTGLNPFPAAIAAGYDQGQRRDGVSSVLTVAGQGSFDERGILLHLDDPVAQLLLALENVAAVLVEGGLDWVDVVQMRISTTDLDAVLDCFDAAAEHLARFGARPPTTFLEVRRLPVRGMTVCVDALAVR